MPRLWWLACAALALAACETGGSRANCSVPFEGQCARPMGSSFPLLVEASTEQTEDEHDGASCGGGGSRVPDVAFQWTAPHAGSFTISTLGSSFDTILYVRRGGCNGEEIACNDDAQTGGTTSRLSVDLEACETVTIVVDGFSIAELGDVRLSIVGREQVCGDGADDDADGLDDCRDTDCPIVRECASSDEWQDAWANFEWDVLEETNRRRALGATCGGRAYPPAPPLAMDAVIRIAARKHSVDMGEQDYFEHDSLDGRGFDDRMRAEGFDGAAPWGENIAAGSTTPRDVVDGWMNSPGHCVNIMNPDFRVIGIGYAVVPGSTFEHYWTQDFAGGH